MKPSACSDIISDPDLMQALHSFAKEQLRSNYDITYKISKKQNITGHKFPTTPGRQRSSSKGPSMKNGSSQAGQIKNRTVFGRALRDLAPNTTIIETKGDDGIQQK